MNETTKKIVSKISGSSISEVEDFIAVEKRLRLAVNDKEILSLFCTPSMVRELVVGMIMTEGIIKGEWCDDMMSIEYGEDIVVNIQAEDASVSVKGKILTTGCAGGITLERKPSDEKIEDSFSIDTASLFSVFKEFQNRSGLYRLTGCVHSAALSDGRNIVAFAEDVGRHNAVDKVIGYSIIEDIKFSGKIMLASGRLSSEMVSKCSGWDIPVVASRAAPTSIAVEIAEARGITLVGFVRGDRMNVYTHPERIKCK